MNSADNNATLGRIYDSARELFLSGQHDRALDRFKSIYEVDIFFRDVQEIINDYYLNDTPRDQWLAKYEARFREQHGTA